MLPHPQPPVVHSPLLCLADVEREIVVLTACCQVTDLLSIVRLLAVSDEVQNGCVVSKLGKEVCAVCCSTVMGEREEQEGAEQAPSLTWVSNHSGGGALTVSMCMVSPSE